MNDEAGWAGDSDGRMGKRKDCPIDHKHGLLLKVILEDGRVRRTIIDDDDDDDGDDDDEHMIIIMVNIRTVMDGAMMDMTMLQ